MNNIQNFCSSINSGSFNAAFTAIRPSVVSSVNNQCASMQPADKDDVVQNAMLALLELSANGNIQDEKKVRSCINNSIAASKTKLEAFKRLSSKKSYELMENIDRKVDVENMLSSLPARDAEILKRRVDGESLQSIGDSYNISKQAVAYAEAKALKKARKSVLDYSV